MLYLLLIIELLGIHIEAFGGDGTFGNMRVINPTCVLLYLRVQSSVITI
jgi:hypothetical protein